jgi:hypothetical protein
VWRYGAALPALALAAAFPAAAVAEPFPTATVHFEQNATDRDSEVVFQVKAADDGLAELTIEAPNGAKVVVFAAPERHTLGIRQFRFESPEPRDLASLRAAYPEGEYVFRGRTFSGAAFAGKSTLSHRLPPTATLVSPSADGHGLPADNAIAWQAAPGASAYLVEIKTDGSSIAARLPASSTSFALPAGFLAAGKTYKLSVGAVGSEGNISFVETTFGSAR